MVFFNSSVSQEDLTPGFFVIFFFFSFLLGSLQTSLFLTPTRSPLVRCGSRIHAPAMRSHGCAGAAPAQLPAEHGSGPPLSHASEAVCSVGGDLNPNPPFLAVAPPVCLRSW